MLKKELCWQQKPHRYMALQENAVEAMNRTVCLICNAANPQKNEIEVLLIEAAAAERIYVIFSSITWCEDGEAERIPDRAIQIDIIDQMFLIQKMMQKGPA